MEDTTTEEKGVKDFRPHSGPPSEDEVGVDTYYHEVVPHSGICHQGRPPLGNDAVGRVGAPRGRDNQVFVIRLDHSITVTDHRQYIVTACE